MDPFGGVVKGEIDYLDFPSFAPPTSAGGFAVVESWGHG